MRIVLLIAVVFAPACQAADATSTTKQPNCAKMDYTSLDTKCCVQPFGNLLTNKQMEVCNPKKNKALYKYINDYMLNKVQSVKLGNTFDMTSPANVKLLCTAATFVNCIVSKYGVMSTDGTWYNASAATALVSEGKTLTEHWNDTAMVVISDEYAFINLYPLLNRTISCPAPKKTTTKVHLGAFFLIQMLHGHNINACEKFVDQDNPKSKCMVTLNTFSECDGRYHDNIFDEALKIIQKKYGSISGNLQKQRAAAAARLQQ